MSCCKKKKQKREYREQSLWAHRRESTEQITVVQQEEGEMTRPGTICLFN